jgi:predicted DNA-binding helix-hairpin-helix protein
MATDQKLAILSDAAKYDASCASSGSSRSSAAGLGSCSTGGICHSWSSDGRCISLLKILLSNRCSNDVPRASFTVDEVVDLTVNFYRRNYIEGLFLSSGVMGSPDDTLERMVAIAERLRHRENFGGYIHLKAIPGASPELVLRAGVAADRVSVNIELPSEDCGCWRRRRRDKASSAP